MGNIMFAAGLGSTGSSALVDLLKEVEGFFSMDHEFRLFVDPGGLVNLRDAMIDNWSVFQTDVAIRNFKKLTADLNRRHFGPYTGLNHSKYFDDRLEVELNKFIDNICDLQYRGMWYGIDNAIIRRLDQFSFLKRKKISSKKMYVGKLLTEEEFCKYANDFISALVNYVLDKNNKIFFCFNENLSCMFPEKILSIVPGAKIVLVVRDPKDVYTDSLRVNWPAIPEDPNDFIKWQILVYKGWMRVQNRFEQYADHEKLLKVVKFEDLIMDYDNVSSEVFDFLNISPESHKDKKKYLDPERSMKNIGQWKGKLSEDVVKKFDAELDFFYSYYNYDRNYD